MRNFELLIIAACSIGGIFAILGSFVIKVLQEWDKDVPIQRIISSKWRFPPKEDKYARRERWARVMGRDPAKTLARLQKPPTVNPPADVTPEQVLAEFVSAGRLQQYRKAIRGGQVAMSQLTGPQMQVGQSVTSALNSKSDSATRARRSAAAGKAGEVEDSDSGAPTDFAPLDPSEMRRMKARVLRVLIEAGPARSLCPITEEKDDSWLPTHSKSSAQVGGWLYGSIWSARGKVTPVVDAELGLLVGSEPWRDGERLEAGVGLKGREALLLDSEPIMMVGTKGVSREMLWLVLALVGGQSFRIEAET